MNEDIREMVRQKYAQVIATRSGCCGGSETATNPVTGNLYEKNEVDGLPKDLLATSLGCGNPTAMANLYAGETVLDLGSGAGLDVLLSAKRVGPTGKAYGLDMTDEMLAEANANKAEAGLANTEFLKGHIEDIPLPEASVDVVISNCVINLLADKDQVFREIHRVLKPGGRVAVSDIVTTKPIPQGVRQSLLAWAGCVAGALTRDEYVAKLTQAGFENAEVVVTRIYDLDTEGGRSIVPEATAEEIKALNGSLASAFIRAKKPAKLMQPGRDFTLREAESAEFPAIHNLLVRNGLPVDGVDPRSGTYYVAANDRVLGALGFEACGSAAVLRSFAVEPEFRKAGVGKALLENLLVKLRTSDFSDVYLLTNTAEGYFANYGFVDSEREQAPAEVLSSAIFRAHCCIECACKRLRL